MEETIRDALTLETAQDAANAILTNAQSGDAAPADDQTVLVLRLIQDHRQMELAWTDARTVLQAVADHGDAAWPGLTVWHQVKLNDFARLYRHHVDDEEKVAYPAARGLLGPSALVAMGEDMMQRRGVMPVASEGLPDTQPDRA